MRQQIVDVPGGRLYNWAMDQKLTFYEKVYSIVETIPPGFVMTYGQIAIMIGHPRGARQVGRAMYCAPRERNLPCHRVVNRLGEMAPSHVFGSEEYQRSLLKNEGVLFLPDGNVDLGRCLFTATAFSHDA
ncbi:MAG: MGMT family protein [Christensenellales bacterium]|jgi:methylated-DNA-protein-cysteine methyltransferase-like protein